jgi:dipeptidyl-peptidase-4
MREEYHKERWRNNETEAFGDARSKETGGEKTWAESGIEASEERRWLGMLRMTYARSMLCFMAWVAMAGQAAGAGEDALRTVGERTEFRATARHAEVVATLDALAASDGRATRVSLGTTTEGREIPMLVLSDPAVRDGEEARRLATEDGKVVILAIGSIHGGEVCGKEALPMLARELLEAGNAGLLRKVILAIAPVYNADGAERFDPGNRPGQNGPEAMGIRHNAMDLDLNRDFVKVEAPETAALLRFFNEWDPHVFIDTHTTNGSFHRYVISYAGAKSLAGDAGVRAFTRDVFLPGVARAYTAICGEPTFYYGSFGGGALAENADDKSRWGTFPGEARFGTTYVGLRGRLSLLSEAYAYAPFRDRVLRTRDFVMAAVGWCAENAPDVRRVTEAARVPSEEVVIRARQVACPGKHVILGYEEEVRDGKRVNTGRPAEYEVVLVDCYEPERTVSRPAAYVIPRDERLAPVVENLRRHGVVVAHEATGGKVKVEAYTITKASPASREFQKHVLVRAEAVVAEKEIDLSPGSWVVRTDQALGNLIVYLLEPESEDGLTAWNYFDAWMKEGMEFPVYRLVR